MPPAEKVMPKFLNTDAKLKRRARDLAEKQTGIASTKASFPRIQGFFSKTVFVVFKDGSEAAVQFRYEPLDVEPFSRARRMIGDVVPLTIQLHDEEVEAADLWPIFMTKMPGEILLDQEDEWDHSAGVNMLASLGRIFAKGFVEGENGEGGDSRAIVTSTIIPRLQKILDSEQEEVKPYQHKVRTLLNEVHKLDILPLQLVHFDLNALNILVLENGEISGLIDWELSPPPQPFGLGLLRIHHPAGLFSEGIYHLRDNYEEMECAFWHEVVQRAPSRVKNIIDLNPDAVQTSFMIATVLDILETSNNGAVFHKPSLRVLPKFLTYRIPAVRGSDAPFLI
ncbi:MAG: hypothetical protein M1828_002574 [Chrysothrix sp. TS-e1954]|nr:MAG: hypothetical protein M1828_002574 [Chrysothrix sp. TS-e1954]